MTRSRRLILITSAWLLLPLAAGQVHAQGVRPDSAGVRRAVADYVEGFYEGDTLKIARSVSPTVHKYGYYIPQNQPAYAGEAMTFREAMDYSRSVKERGRQAKPDAPKVIQLLDVLDQTAAAKLTAWWGVDYLLLAKINGKWMITHVVWQSPPPKS